MPMPVSHAAPSSSCPPSSPLFPPPRALLSHAQIFSPLPLYASRYLKFVASLVDQATFAATAEAVEDFREGAGPSVQASLVAKDQHSPDTSYIAGEAG